MRRTSLTRKLLLFFFYSSLLLTVPQYVECEDLYPDEIIDFLGIHVQSAVTLEHDASPPVLTDSAVRSSERQRAEKLPVALYIGKLVLSVALLC